MGTTTPIATLDFSVRPLLLLAEGSIGVAELPAAVEDDVVVGATAAVVTWVTTLTLVVPWLVTVTVSAFVEVVELDELVVDEVVDDVVDDVVDEVDVDEDEEVVELDEVLVAGVDVDDEELGGVGVLLLLDDVGGGVASGGEVGFDVGGETAGDEGVEATPVGGGL